ncbi:MAG: sulfide/dihydroorotate dehydrogenase-like FAD/NAD-binding protein [Salinivirgaceae bacterium]|nr:sulfide/dihydroorotate dehydrogenase-like FAD/NAD-binding protein [Salinivirgaceae bacterium]
MNKIVAKEYFSENVVRLEIEAPLIAKSRKAGNFVIVKIGDKGERIPLTISDANIEKGTIDLVVQRIGVSSRKLTDLNVGDYVTDLVGPLGRATEIENFGTVLACGGGVGVAPLLPIVEAMKKAGNRVISILAARSKDLIILEDQMRKWSDEVIIMTDDGSYGEKGNVTVGMEKAIAKEKIDKAIVIAARLSRARNATSPKSSKRWSRA